MKCGCGEQGELKVFNTFEFYYCKKCKKEIESKKDSTQDDNLGYDPFNPNNSSVDDFYLSLATKNIDQAARNIANSFNNDGLVTITLPSPEKGMYFEIYRRCADDSFKKLHIEQVHYENDGKNWKRIKIERN